MWGPCRDAAQEHEQPVLSLHKNHPYAKEIASLHLVSVIRHALSIRADAGPQIAIAIATEKLDTPDLAVGEIIGASALHRGGVVTVQSRRSTAVKRA